MVTSLADGLVLDRSEIPEGTSKLVKLGQVEIGVFNIGGEFYALSNWCPHQGGPTCTGRISGTTISDQSTDWKIEWVREGEILYCPWHAFEFDIKDGRCISRDDLRVRTYRVKTEGSQIRIET